MNRSRRLLMAATLVLAVAPPAAARPKSQAAAPRWENPYETTRGSDPVPPPATNASDQPGPGWRGTAFYGALAAAGLALAAGGAGTYVAIQKTHDFNGYRAQPVDPSQADRCYARLPRAGAPGCAGMLADRNDAHRIAMIGFAAAGLFAATAIILRLTEPDRERPPGAPDAGNALALTCAPGAGLAAACRLRF